MLGISRIWREKRSSPREKISLFFGNTCTERKPGEIQIHIIGITRLRDEFRTKRSKIWWCEQNLKQSTFQVSSMVSTPKVSYTQSYKESSFGKRLGRNFWDPEIQFAHWFHWLGQNDDLKAGRKAVKSQWILFVLLLFRHKTNVLYPSVQCEACPSSA